MTTKEELFRAARDKVNDYEQTVNAILSFAAFVVHDGKSRRPHSKFGIGRRMTTSQNNSVSPDSKITPDLVAQKSLEYGIVAEAKKTLNQNQSNWISHVEQLRKYDDKLEGWWTEDQRIAHADTIMLIHQSRVRPFTRFFQHQKEINPDFVGPNTCVVEFAHSGETVPYYFFRLELGDIPDNELGPRLEDGVNVPLDNVRISFPSIQYYDAKPPIPLLLFRLWTDVFPSMLEDGEHDEKTGLMKIQVSVPNITDELQKAFGSKALGRDNRSGEFPKQKWVREAFEQLISYKLAIPRSGEDGEYIIYYRTFRDDVLDRFIKLESEKSDVKKVTVPEKQLSMFSDVDKP